jgi:hypothetical protein
MQSTIFGRNVTRGIFSFIPLFKRNLSLVPQALPGPSSGRARKVGGKLLALAIVALWGQGQVEATVTLTGATGGTSISATTAANAPSPAWTTLGPITITEGANADFGTGTSRTLILEAPTGFVFNTAVTPSISYTASRNITAASIAVTDSNTLTITFSVSGTTRADSLVIGGTTGLQVRPTASAPLASGRHIYRPATGGGNAVISGITTSSDGTSGSNFGNLNEVAGPASQLAFATQPGNAAAGAAFSTQPVVVSRDQFGNNSTNGLPTVNFVTVSLTSGTGPLQGTTLVDLGLGAGRGTATFSGLRIDPAGIDKQLTVAATNGLASATSSVFAVSAGAPSVVTVQTQPSATATAGVVFAQQPIVQVADAFGNPCNTAVTAARASGSGTLQGTVTLSAINGVATYTDLSHPLIGTITISFTSGSASATSTPVAVSAGPFTRLQVLLPGETAAPGTASGKAGTPTVQTAGTALGAVVVNAVDEGWNVVNTVGDNIHLTSTDPNASLPSDASLVSGTVIFSGVRFSLAGAQALTAADVADGTKIGTSSSVTVNPGTFSKIQLLMPGETAAPGTVSGKTGSPTAQTAGTAFSVRVNGVDANWNPTPTASGSGFTIQLGSSDANATLPAAADLASGAQTLSVTLKTAGAATITATDLDSPGLTSTSPSTVVNSGLFTKLQLLMPGETAAPGTASGKTGTASAQRAGTSFNVTINAVDANWNPVSTAVDQISLTATDPNATLPAAGPLSGGTRSFSLALNTTGSRTVTAADSTDGTKTASTSPAVTVNAGPFAQLQVLVPGETAVPGTLVGKTGSPTNQIPGIAFNVIVNGVDSRWNLVPTNDTVHLTSSDASAALPADAPLVGGTITRALTLNATGSFTVSATDATTPGVSGNTSTALTVAKANQTITFGTLTNRAYGSAPFTLSATASSGLSVAFSVVSGPATVSGTTLTITGIGTVTVRASQAGNTSYNAAANVDQSFTVSAAVLTVKADDKSRVFGQANPPLTATISGFVNSDTSSILTGTPTLSTSAGAFSTEGNYTITVTKGSLATTNGNYTFAFTNGVLTIMPLASGMVAIHDSEYTRGLETIPATYPTPPAGYPGTTGFEWWPTNWQYSVLPEAMKEALRSDGTAFTVVSDASISAGTLLDSKGKPRYPILISLASEAIADNEIAALTNYVAAGGFLLVGSSSFTRRPDGGPRGDFAFPDEMGIHSAPADFYNLENWIWNSSFTKAVDHPILSHLPNGQLRWTAPASADETAWGLSPGHTGPYYHLVWNVLTNGATVLARGDTSPQVLVNPFGKGWFVYHAAMQPLIGHGGYNSGMYSYAFFRKTIEWAFSSARLPIPKLSPWPYSYDAAALFRHDMESFTNFISAIEGSAQYENSVGARGDYYFCTGAMRDYYNATDRAAAIASLQRAISLYGATIGSHNGGLSNFYNTALSTNAYDYYHWGPDEVLDFDPPAGFASAQAYALTSLSNSFVDLQGWGLTNASGLRFYASPYFNGSRDRSFAALEQLKVATTGDEKLSPFPHFVRASQSPYKAYSFVNLPVSDWYVGNQVAQSIESHTVDSIHAGVDFYYNLGALINFYSHSSSAGGPSLYGESSMGWQLISQPAVEQENVRYTMGKPRVWAANAEAIYNWWTTRSNAQLNVTTMTNTGDQFTAVLGISGARDGNTAIELLLPNTAFTGLQVRTNGVLTSNGYRLNGQTLKILVGTNVGTAQIQYTLPPLAQPDFYSTIQNVPVGVGAPGVLTNDSTGASGGALTAQLVAGPAHGSLLLSTNGSFTYTPVSNYFGADGFTYQVSDGVSTSATSTVTIQVTQPGVLLSDDFTRPADPGLLDPWTNWIGGWSVTGGVANVTSAAGYSMVYTGVGSNDYWFEAQIKFSSTGVIGGGLGGRFDPLTGHQYAVWVYPENSQGPAALVRLVKFGNSTAFPFTTLQQVTLTNEVSTNWHNLKLKFQGNQIKVFLDRSEIISVVDNGSFDGTAAYTNGGVTFIQYGGPTAFTMSVDNALATSLANTPVLVVTATNQTRPYGTTNAPLTGSLAGIQQSDNITATYSTVADQTSPVGSYPIAPAFLDPDRRLGNYIVTTNSGFLTVTQAILTVTALNTNKVYGQTLSFAGTEFSISGLMNSDLLNSLALTSAGAASTAPVNGTPYPIVPSSASGVGLSNYSVVYVNGGLTVAPAPLNCTAADTSRPYGTANPLFAGTLTGVVAGDEITATYGTLAVLNSAIGQYPITPTLIDPNNRLSNYAPTLKSGTLTISPATLTVTATGVNRAYDGTVAATVQLADNRLAGDSLSVTYGTAAFTDKNVGQNKAISVSGIATSGAAAGNYTANTTASAAANITALGITGTVSINNKAYDGTTQATIANRTLTGAISGDQLTLGGGTANFNDKSIGSNKPVTISGLTLSGADAGNYTCDTTANALADITGRALAVSAQGVNKTYDGTTNATVTLQDDRLAGDTITVSYSQAGFSDKNVGTTKLITVSGIAVTGADAGNYTCNTSTTATADITARTLLVTAAGINKVYDGTNAASVTLSDNRLAGDVLTESYSAASFADKTVGTLKPVSVSGISLAGVDATNYVCNATTSATADIGARELTGIVTANNKTYDGTSTATLSSRQLTGVVPGDTVAYVGGTATFANKNVGVGKVVTATGLSLTGTDAGNYSCSTSASTTADISGLPLSVTATAVNKVYDGLVNATVTLADNRLAGDSFTVSYTSATFASKNASIGKSVTVSGINLSGPDAGNYTPNPTANATADIAPLALTIAAQGVDKVYDGTTTATVLLTDNRIPGDSLNPGYSTASYADKRVASGKLVTVTGLTLAGPDAPNYTFNTSAAASANITARPLTVTATAASKVYDGTVNASVSLSDDRLPGDILTANYTSASFADKHAGTSKPVSVSGLTIGGADAVNYSANGTAGATATITPATLTITAQGVNRDYEGTTAATVILSDNRLPGDSITPSYATASFVDKSVGTGKFVSINGIGLSGADAGNYTYNTTAFTAASITPRALLVSAQAANKAYDGTSAATVTLADNRVPGDVLTPNFTSAAFADKNVGAAKAVTVNGITVAGTDASNYSPNTTAATTADISARSLTVSAEGVNKVYDATTTATVTLSDNRLVGDSLTTSYASATFSDKVVGTAKNVSVTGIALSGSDAGNYTPNPTANTTASITVRGLTVTAVGATKVYDGTTTATVSLSDNRVTGDLLTDSYIAASFSDKNTGLAKAIAVSGISISGIDAANYLVNTAATTSADITPASLTITADPKTKTYGDPNPALTASIAGYVEANSASALSGQPSLTTSATDSSPAGSYPITASAGTLSAPNYIFTFVPGVLTILPPPNTAPVLPTQANRNLTELTTLTVLNRATDSDVPANTLTYQLVAPPEGMQISSDGTITWTPSLTQSPSSNLVTTVVTDNGTPVLSATNRFTVVVSSPYDGINLTDAAQAQADTDGDGLSNLMEYGLGTDPRNASDSGVGLVSGVVTSSGNRYASIQFKRRKLNGGISIQYVPEVSGDRQTWFSDGSHIIEINVSTLDAQFDWVIVRDLTPSSSSIPRYIRLRVVEN